MAKKIRAFIYVLLYITCYIIAEILAVVVPPAYRTLTAKGSMDDFFYYISPAQQNMLYISSVTVAVTLLFFYVTFKIRKIRVGSYISAKALTIKHIASAVFLTYGIIVVAKMITSLPVLKPYRDVYNENMAYISGNNLWVALIVIGIAAPMFEEVMYRGVILSEFRKGFSFFTANLFQAALFGVMHFDVIQGIYAGIIGFILGYAYKISGTIYLTALIHILFNATNVLLSGVAAGGGLTVSAGSAFFSLLLGFLLLRNNK